MFSVSGAGGVAVTGTLSVSSDAMIMGALTASSGLAVTNVGLTVAGGGLKVSASGLTVAAGGLTVTAGGLQVGERSVIHSLAA